MAGTVAHRAAQPFYRQVEQGQLAENETEGRKGNEA
jgi:hypothetical protein